MPNFFSDNDDLQFYFDRALDWSSLVEVVERGYRVADGPKDVAEAVATYREVLQLIGEVTAEEIAPRAARIEAEPPRLENGEVVQGAAMREIFKRLHSLDLQRVPIPRELGGMNAPFLVEFLSQELFARADLSAMVHHTFHAGIAVALLTYSLNEGSTKLDPETGSILETRFAAEIDEIARGAAWGSMDITEPGAGSDMAALRTFAEQDEAGNWTVSGEKIFITSGHGKYHIVIARTEKPAGGSDPFAGLGGLSLFLVKAYDDAPDGTRTRHVKIDRLEEKMGQHGSVTAALVFERAPAELIGKRGEGFKYMLILMNNARLAIGFQSLGVCEAAHRMASAYAATRVSMGKPIARHEMIADFLDEMRTDIQAMRALAVHAAYHEEMSRRLAFVEKHGGSPAEIRQLARIGEHQAKARRATPLLKHFAAERAVDMARRAIQIHGGIGYMREIGAERLLRDSMVAPIYEGTTQIQALMATKDTLGAILKRPQAFVTRRAQTRWRVMSARDELERRVAKISDLSLSAQQHLVTRTATSKLRTLADVPVAGWPQALSQKWDPKRDFAYAMLHADRLTKLLTDELIGEILLDQARRFPERRELLERWIERAEPRCRMLHDEITTTGARLLASLAGDAAPAAEKAAG